MTQKRNNKTITLGSGKIFYQKFTGTIPENTVLETDANLLGLIKGGAELTYTPEFYKATDDLGLVVKQIVTSEVVVLKSGIMTWNAETLAVLSATGRVTSTAGERTLKIGGIQNVTNEKYVIHFVHKDAVDGDVRVTIVGQNLAGFTLNFAPDAETVIDAEFTALPNIDSDGTLVRIVEEIGAIAGFAATGDETIEDVEVYTADTEVETQKVKK